MSNAKNNFIQTRGPRGIIVGNCSPKVHKVRYLWVIRNYSFYDEKGDFLVTPSFTADTNDKCKWYLMLKPNNEPADTKTISVGLVLHPTSECKVVFAKFDLSILDGMKTKVYSTKNSKIHKYELEPYHPSWGYAKFPAKHSIFKFMSNDKLTIYCKVTFSEVKDSVDSVDLSISSQPKHRVLEDLPEDLKRLFKSQDFTDVEIFIKGIKCFQAHKSILAARSPVFAAMFKHNTIIDIPDIDEKIIGEMLYYMYTGKCKNLNRQAGDLLKAADKYGIEGLKAKCENVLMKNLSVENAIDTLILADLYRAHELKSQTINFIVEKSTEVMNKETLNKIVSTNPRLISEVSHKLPGHNCSSTKNQLCQQTIQKNNKSVFSKINFNNYFGKSKHYNSLN